MFKTFFFLDKNPRISKVSFKNLVKYAEVTLYSPITRHCPFCSLSPLPKITPKGAIWTTLGNPGLENACELPS